MLRFAPEDWLSHRRNCKRPVKIAVGLALALVGLLGSQPAWAAAALEVESTGGCVDTAATRARLAPVLAPYADARGGTVAVVVQRSGDFTSLTLRVVAISGDVVLERRLTLRPEDCPSAPELIATILERFLRDFPRARWTDLPHQNGPMVVVMGQELPWIASVVRASLAGRWPGPSADLDLGATLETGTARRRLFASTNLRVGTPARLGVGHVVDGVAALGMGWREIGASWVGELEVRVGGRVTAGYGYTVNRRVWLPWMEVGGGISWPWHGWLLGPVVGISPLRQRATTAAGAYTPLPWLRLGVSASLPLVVDLL